MLTNRVGVVNSGIRFVWEGYGSSTVVNQGM